MPKDHPTPPPFWLDHVLRLTDDVGIIQHAYFSVPRRGEGYATDDNARALELMARLPDDTFPVRQELATRYLAFLAHSFSPEHKRFANFMSYARRWLEVVGSEDSHGRSLCALGHVLASPALATLHGAARHLWDSAIEETLGFSSPRAWAYTAIGISCYENSHGEAFRFADKLEAMLAANSSADWKWFEPVLSYGNATLAEGAIAAAEVTGQSSLQEGALSALRWLCEGQIIDGHFVPVGSNGFQHRGGPRARYDQQPIEACATISAASRAFRLTKDPYWLAVAESAFAWFLGANDLGLSLFDSETGGCRDGLHVDRLNENQGAESTLVYLAAALTITELRSNHSDTKTFLAAKK